MPDSAEKVSPTRTRLVYRLEDLTIDVGTAEVRRGDQPSRCRASPSTSSLHS